MLRRCRSKQRRSRSRRQRWACVIGASFELALRRRFYCWSAALLPPSPRSRAARCASTTPRSRQALRSTRNRRLPPTCRSWRCSTISCGSTPRKPRNGFDAIVPELAESWAWDTTGTKLTFKLRSGVTWHDGKPFTAKDVQCTWHRLNGKEAEYLRRNPRAIWYENLKEVTLEGDYEATFHLTKPQPSLLPMLASGLSPVYPCHVSDKDMRTKPVGTGPFKFAEFKSHASIKLVRNPDYWKKGLPYLDAIEWRIITSRSTRVLAFVAGEFDMTFVGDITVPLMKDVRCRPRPRSAAWCRPTSRSTSWSTGTGRRSTRSSCAAPWPWRSTASPTSTSSRAERCSIAGNMMPPPEGLWGMPHEMLAEAAELQPGRGGATGRRAQDHAGPRLRTRQPAQGEGLHARLRHLSRSRGDLRRPAQQGALRRRAGGDRVLHLAQSPDEEGLHGRAQHLGRRHRRSRRGAQGRLRLQLGSQLHAVLHAAGRQAARRAVAAGRRREAQGDRVGDRARAGRGRGPPDRLPQPIRHLLAPASQGLRAPGEQHL